MSWSICSQEREASLNHSDNQQRAVEESGHLSNGEQTAITVTTFMAMIYTYLVLNSYVQGCLLEIILGITMSPKCN